MNLRRVILASLLLGLLLAGGGSTRVWGRQLALQADPAGVKGPNQVLLAASSPFEDLIDAALAGNADGITQALQAYQRQAAAVDKVLEPPARQDLASLVADLRQAAARGDNQAAANDAVAAYRFLTAALEPQSLTVPVQVAWLDYAGFKLRVLLHGPTPDWSAVADTVAEAKQAWRTLEPRVADGSLRDAVKTVLAGMERALKAQNAEMASFAAQMDLALVDLLEESFRPKGK